MSKTDIIKTYNFEPNYYEYEKQNYYSLLKIFNNNIYMYIYIKIYNDTFYKTKQIKQIKQNYIIFSYFIYYKNIIIKVKNYDNTKINIENGYDAYI